MIRFQRLSIGLLDDWLVEQGITGHHRRYRLRVWRENRAALAGIRDELVDYIEEAFEDARRRIRRGFEDDLSPFNDVVVDPAAGYPAMLHRLTLKGYFGETLAAIAIEHWGALGHEDWVVPAFLFRLHDQEFQHLETIHERVAAGEEYNPDDTAEIRTGRTGDDGLAFRINERNTITDVLSIEAKCLSQNRNEKIEEAHLKLTQGGLRPPGVRELINLLDEYDTPEAEAWQEALLNLWRSEYSAVGRHDCVGYACGAIPRRGGRIAWLPTDAPHPAYTADRNLECVEFQFQDLDTIIDILYRGF